MLHIMPTAHEDILAFGAKGKLTKEDYKQRILPRIERAQKTGKKIKILLQLESDFGGFTPAAAWEEIKMVRYSDILDRVAVVSDKKWANETALFLGEIMPCTVQVFYNQNLDKGIEWLNKDISKIDYILDKTEGTLRVNVTSALSSADFNCIAKEIDQWISLGHQLNGILINIKEFSGWEGIGSIISHFKFINGHHKKIKKVAICCDTGLLNFTSKVANHFVDADIMYFKRCHLAEAISWIKS